MSVESMEMRIDCTGAADNLWFGDVFFDSCPPSLFAASEYIVDEVT
jgi:hypothetical protein